MKRINFSAISGVLMFAAFTYPISAQSPRQVAMQKWYAANRTTSFADLGVLGPSALAFDGERGGRARLAFHTNQPRTMGITVRRNF